MTDTTTIAEAYETVMSAETTALNDFQTAYNAFTAALNGIIATLGTTGPQTTAKQFLSRTQTTVTSMMAMDLQSVLNTYGLTQPAAPILPTA